MERAAAKHLASVYVKGIGMGAADIVPGVSGGTIAFITGIYQELIDSIGSIGPKTLRILFKEGVVAAWNSINATFLLVLMLGILTSVFTLSKMISHLLHTYPELLWSFFFGLILVSALHVGRTITQWRMSAVVNLVLGVVVAFGITSFSPMSNRSPETMGSSEYGSALTAFSNLFSASIGVSPFSSMMSYFLPSLDVQWTLPVIFISSGSVATAATTLPT